MLRRGFLALAGAGMNAPAFHRPARKLSTLLFQTGAKSIDSGFAPVNGLRLYYEIQGRGKPLVFLHGGVTPSEEFGPHLAELARTRKIIAVHLQGHGRTKDIDRPLQFETMADDVAALLGYLKIDKADVLGYSMGGGVALQTAIRHPGAVNRLVVVSSVMQRNGWFPEVNAKFRRMASEAPMIARNIRLSPLGRKYPDVNWETLLPKLGELETEDFDWSEQVRKIGSPTMLIFADADAIRPEHIMAFYEALGGGKRDAGQNGALRSTARLGIVPGATHYDILSTAAMTGMVGPFLS